MIINRNDLENRKLDEVIIKQIILLAKEKMSYRFDAIELKFCIKKIEGDEGYK